MRARASPRYSPSAHAHQFQPPGEAKIIGSDVSVPQPKDNYAFPPSMRDAVSPAKGVSDSSAKTASESALRF